MNRSKLQSILAIVLGVLFALFGVMKFVGGQAIQDQFIGWGYPTWFAYVTGIVELLTAALLFWPRGRPFGALLGVVVMLVAAVTHLRVPEVGLLPLGIPMLLGCVWLMWQQRSTLRALGGAPA